MNQIQIGKISIDRTACLAPMASVADRAYRVICKEYGASYVVSEMVSTKGLCYGDKKTAVLCTVTDEERPMALQLFGDEPDCFAKAVELCEPYAPDIFDINMGCPVPKIAGNGAGSALMKTPELAYEIVRAAVQNTDRPVTVKIRRGWDADHVNAVEFAKAMEEAGASAIAVHGRTRNQMYSGKADREIIKAVKNAVSVPVIGNGDIFTPEDAKSMYEETGCNLVMVGRGTYGKPWIFRQINEYLAGKEISPEPEIEERLDIMKHHVSLIAEFKGEHTGIREARKIIAWYLKGLPNSAVFRNACGSLKTYEDVKKLSDEFLKQYKERME